MKEAAAETAVKEIKAEEPDNIELQQLKIPDQDYTGVKMFYDEEDESNAAAHEDASADNEPQEVIEEDPGKVSLDMLKTVQGAEVNLDTGQDKMTIKVILAVKMMLPKMKLPKMKVLKLSLPNTRLPKRKFPKMTLLRMIFSRVMLSRMMLSRMMLLRMMFPRVTLPVRMSLMSLLLRSFKPMKILPTLLVMEIKKLQQRCGLFQCLSFYKIMTVMSCSSRAQALFQVRVFASRFYCIEQIPSLKNCFSRSFPWRSDTRL